MNGSWQALPLTSDERAAIERLASDIPTLWTAPTTTAADRQAIARLMLDRVVVAVQGKSELVLVECHWGGGMRTQHDLRRPVAHLTQRSDHAALLQRIHALHSEGRKAPAISGVLNAEGWTPPKRRATYNAAMVRSLLRRLGMPTAPRLSWTARLQGREPGEITIDELATRLGAPHTTVHRWIQRGVVIARKVPVLTHSVWLVHADEAEIDRLRHRRLYGAGQPITPNHS